MTIDNAMDGENHCRTTRITQRKIHDHNLPENLTKFSCENVMLFLQYNQYSMFQLKKRESLGLSQTEARIATKLTLGQPCLHVYQICHLRVQPRKPNPTFRYEILYMYKQEGFSSSSGKYVIYT